MSTKQFTTYHDNFNIKTFTEFLNGEVVLIEYYNEDGNLTFSLQSGEWYRWEYDKLKNVIYHEDYTGYCIKRKYGGVDGKVIIYEEDSERGLTIDIENDIGHAMRITGGTKKWQ